MAKKGDKFLDKMKKDARNIGDVKLKNHHAKHRPEHIIKHNEHHEPEREMENKISPRYEMKSIDNTLVENFVSLQKVMTNLSMSLDNLSSRLSRLLDLFEASVRSLSEKDMESERRNDEIKRKIDTLMEQNKIFAKGLTLLHERAGPPQFNEGPRYEEPRPLPRMPVQTMEKRMDNDGYQKSISSPKS